MEDKLARLESKLSVIWKGIAQGTVPLTYFHKEVIDLFIATLIFRHPNHEKKIEYVEKDICNKLFEDIPKSIENIGFIVNGKETIVNVEKIKGRKMKSDNEIQISFIKYLDELSMKFSKMLLKKKWSILVSSKREFITSDKPVVITNPKTGFLGINSEGVIIYFPLSPTRLLILEDNLDNESDTMSNPLNNVYAPYFNHKILSNAYKYVISNRDIKEVATEIEKFYENEELK